MIRLENVSKTYRVRGGHHTVLDAVSLSIPAGAKIGILGANGAGKSTLVRLISGAEQPTRGRIERGLSVSWPLALSGAFQGSLTGVDNVYFICRLYGADPTRALQYVEDFAELGKFLREPVKHYSSGMQARLAFALSMVIEFDCFLIDEVITVGDARFKAKCHVELFEKRADRAMIIVSHEPGFIRDHCEAAAVLRDGRLSAVMPVDSAYAEYTAAASVP